MALDTVGDYVGEARRLLQDTRTPYRYSDADMTRALGLGLLETARVRADLFITTPVPNIIEGTPLNTTITFPGMYRPSLLNWLVGHMKLRDEEEGDSTGAAWKQDLIRKLVMVG